MIDETLDLFDSFVAVALEHNLIDPFHGEEILRRAQEKNTSQADIALSSSYMTPQLVSAVELLMRPTGVAPGYRLTGLIGCGAVGIVFRAKQMSLDRDVAVKTISLTSQPNQSSIDRIQREAHAIARLKHPNIIAVHDSGFYQGCFWMVIELVEGEDLHALIERSTRLSEGVAWRIVRQIASALAHAYEAGIIHRDVKPANVLLTQPPSGSEFYTGVPLVKVADFGLAFEPAEKDQANLTATGTALGTPAYVAPEQLQDTHVDARADIYSLGATLFHMLSGTVPFADSSSIKVIIGKATGNDVWRDTLPDHLTQETVDLFRAMTESNPDHRIGNYQALIQQIDEVLAKIDSQKTSVWIRQPPKRSTGEQQRQFLTAKVKLVSASLLAAVMLMITMGIWMRRSKASAPVKASHIAAGWQVQNFPQPLFDGQSVPIYPQSGSWSIDGAFTLVGGEKAWMTIPLEGNANYRFRVSTLVANGHAVEIVLPQPLQDRASVSLVLQDSTARLISTELREPIAKTVQLDLRPVDIDQNVRQEIHMYRLKNDLGLIVNGTPLGRFQCTSATQNQLTLKVIQGKASFADMDVAKLERE